MACIRQGYILFSGQARACILICRKEVQIAESTPNLSDVLGQG